MVGLNFLAFSAKLFESSEFAESSIIGPPASSWKIQPLQSAGDCCLLGVLDCLLARNFHTRLLNHQSVNFTYFWEGVLDVFFP